MVAIIGNTQHFSTNLLDVKIKKLFINYASNAKGGRGYCF